MNINALLEEKTKVNLEELIEGWKIDKDKKIILDSNGKIYPYIHLEKFDIGYKVCGGSWIKFIFPRENTVFEEIRDFIRNDKIIAFVENKESKRRCCLISKDNVVKSRLYHDAGDLRVDNNVVYFVGIEGVAKERVIKLSEDGESRSSSYEGIINLIVENGVACFLASKNGFFAVNLFDGKREMTHGFYDHISDLKYKDGIAAFVGMEHSKWRVVLLNWKKSVLSDLYGAVKIKKFENGVLYFEGKEGNEWGDYTLSIR